MWTRTLLTLASALAGLLQPYAAQPCGRRAACDGAANARPAPPPPTRPRDWIEPMRRVHARFTGRPGTLALFGDSTTTSLAFWASLRYEHRNMDERGETALEQVKSHMLSECWSNWRGPEFGNDSAKTSEWAATNVSGWLKNLNPEAAVVLFGPADLKAGVTPARFERAMREVVRKCLDNGTVVILTTVPPSSGNSERARELSRVVRRTAAEGHTPLIPFAREIRHRRPDDWDGSAPKFAGAVKADGDVYDVPTLISADGVHPSYPRLYAGDYSREALDCSGYGLRNYLTLVTYADVIREAFQPATP